MIKKLADNHLARIIEDLTNIKKPYEIKPPLTKTYFIEKPLQLAKSTIIRNFFENALVAGRRKRRI